MAKRVAFFVERIVGSYQNDIIRVIADRTEELGYELEVFSGFGTYGENYLHAEGERNFNNLPYLEDYTGIILAPDTFNTKDMYEELAEKIERQATCPVVSLRYKDERFYNVLIDDYAAMTGMVEHFVEKHGFKRICFMTGKIERADAQLRLRAYRDVMEKHHLPVTEHMIFEGDYWKYKGEKAVDWFLQNPEIPEAIVCSNDYMAISVFEALRKRGYRVPGDICLSGFDNIDEAKYFDPPIAGIDVPTETMGQTAVDIIDKITKGGASEKDVYVSVKEQWEGTCGCGNGLHERQVTKLYNKNEYLKYVIEQITYMNVDFESCDTLEELLHNAYTYSFTFMYDTMYICLCDENNRKDAEMEEAEQYTENMYLKAIMSRDLGVTVCEELFPRREILPQKYKALAATTYLIPLHYKNHSLGYLALQTEKINSLKEIFPAWTMFLSGFIDKVHVYVENCNLMSFREQALKDELTGLYNRRMLEKALKTRMQKAYGQKSDFCIVSIDMDGLKYINDTFGHMEGDNALCGLADTLKAVSGESVIAARVGGDEFTLCVDTSDESKVLELVKDIYTRIQAYNDEKQKAYQLSASIGYAFYQRGEELITCMKRADENMYVEKTKKKQNRT